MVSFAVNTHTHTHTHTLLSLFRFHLFSFISIALGDIQKDIAANYAKECTAYPIFHSDFHGIWSYIKVPEISLWSVNLRHRRQAYTMEKRQALQQIELGKLDSYM